MWREKLGLVADRTLAELAAGLGSLIVLFILGRAKGLLLGRSLESRPDGLAVRPEKEEMKMEKAYDVKDLLNRLKNDGLELAEKEAGLFYKHLKEWFQESAVLSPNKIDDVVAPFASQLDPIMLPLIDKIDGQKD